MGSSAEVPSWAQVRPAGVAITVVVSPGARATEVVGTYGDALKVRVAAPPTEGKANAQLIRFIARTMGIPASDVRLLFGHSARRKGLLIVGCGVSDIVESLQPPRAG